MDPDPDADTGGPPAESGDTGGSDAGGGGDTGGSSDGGGDSGEAGLPTAAACFTEQGLNVDYDQFSPTIGSHCAGTNHQDIAGVEHVGFFGDSITVGTPPTAADDWYRNRLGEDLILSGYHYTF